MTNDHRRHRHFITNREISLTSQVHESPRQVVVTLHVLARGSWIAFKNDLTFFGSEEQD